MKKASMGILLFTCLLLCNCASESTIDDSIIANEALGEITKFEILHNTIKGDRKLAKTKDGVYILEQCYSNSDFLNINYIDFNTKTSMLLCAKPECSHDNEDCTACVPSSNGGGYGCVINDKLYFTFAGNVAFKTNPKIISMDLNGNNHKTITELKSNQEISAPLVTDNENLYLISKNFEIKDDGAIKTFSQLLQINLVNGATREIAKWDSDVVIWGAIEDKIIIMRPENFDTAGTSIYIPNSKNEYAVLEIDVEGSQEELFKVSESNTIGQIVENDFFYIDTKNWKLCKRNLKDETSVEICDFPKSLIESINFYGMYDNFLIVNASKNQNGRVSSFRYCINLTDKSIKAIDMQIYFDGIKSDKKVQILQQINSDLLVISQYKTLTQKAAGKDGIIKEFTSSIPQYSTITVEDFFAQMENYIEIK